VKTILLCITLIFSGLALGSYTNDEGENDLDVLLPDEDETSLVEGQKKPSVKN